MFSIIRSSDKTTGTTGDCVLHINEKMSGQYGLYSFIFTNVLYNVNSTNNRLILANTSDVVFSDTTLDKGFYTGTELADAITNAISTITCTFDDTTHKFKFVYLPSLTQNFKLLFASYDNTAHELLGFENIDYTSSNNILSSVVAADLIPYKDLFVTIKEANKKVTNNSHSNHNDYCMIINDNLSSFGSLFRYKQEDVTKQQTIQLSPTRQLSVQIYDDEDNIVNTSNWIMILQRK